MLETGFTFILQLEQLIRLKKIFQLEPRLIYRTVQGIKSTVEKALWANCKQRFSFGIGLRTGAATSFK